MTDAPKIQNGHCGIPEPEFIEGEVRAHLHLTHIVEITSRHEFQTEKAARESITNSAIYHLESLGYEVYGSGSNWEPADA